MTTQKQIKANQRNAKKSTGPITDVGKLTVSRNATTHGLTAARVLPEEQEEFDRFAAALSYEWQPDGPLEQFHLERLIHCAWRLKRITDIETSVLFGMCQKEQRRDGETLGCAYIKASLVLNTVFRHERQIERSLREAQHELELLRYARVTQVEPFYARNLRKFSPQESTHPKDPLPEATSQ
jgi:hypothetical protein